MNTQTKFQIDLTVRSFAYVAMQLATSPSAQFAQILNEAERHRQALRLVQRDVLELANQQWRERALTETAFQRLRKEATRIIEQAQEKISRIAEQYSPQKLAA